MAVSTVRLSEPAMKAVTIAAKSNKRSIPKQIEWWIEIGKLCELNQDLPLKVIKSTLEGLRDLEEGTTDLEELDGYDKL